MKSGTRGVCIIAALMVILLASGTVASAAALLSGDEMNGLRGGNSPPQLYCVVYLCGGFEDCKQSPTGYCRPTDQNYPCDNLRQRSEYVDDCGSVTPNENPCTPGPSTSCGYYGQCACNYYWFLDIYVCENEEEDHSFYNPCEP